MAGSYAHCNFTRDGKVFHFDEIENLGDAYEACEMMFHMIYTLSGGDVEKITQAESDFYDSINPSRIAERESKAKKPE